MAQYIHVGILLITVPNLILIVLMLLVFGVSVAVSLPQEQSPQEHTEPPTPPTQRSEQ